MDNEHATPVVTLCQCSNCQKEVFHPDQELHRQMNLFFSRLDEQQRRWYAAIESKRLGHGGDRLVSRIVGISEKTIRRGRRELATALIGRPIGRVRRRRKSHSHQNHAQKQKARSVRQERRVSQ